MRIARFVLCAAAICLLATGSNPALARDWTTDLLLIGSNQSLDIEGNQYRYMQYATPASGVFLDELRLVSEAPENLVLARAETIGEPDKIAGLALYGTTTPLSRLTWRYGDFTFHPEFDANEAEHRTSIVRFGMRSKPGTPLFEFGLFDQSLTKDAELDYPSFRSTDITAGVPFSIGSADLKAVGLLSGFTDLLHDQPDFRYRGYGLDGALPVGDRFLLGADVSHLTASPRDFGRSGDFTGVLADASYLVSPSLSLRGLYRLYERDTPMTENEYSKRIATAAVEATYRPIRMLNLRVGGETRRIDHLDLFRDRTDTPKVDTYWVRMRFRPNPVVEISGRYNNRRLFEQPGIGLYPRDSIFTEASMAYTPLANAGFTATYNTDKRRNPFLDINYSLAQTLFGFWWAPSDRLSFSFNDTIQDWSSSAPFLTDWLTDARISGVSTSYLISQRTSFEASYFHCNTTGVAVQGKEDDVFVGLRRQIAPNFGTVFGFERAIYRDERDSSLDFTANRFRAGISTTF